MFLPLFCVLCSLDILVCLSLPLISTVVGIRLSIHLLPSFHLLLCLVSNILSCIEGRHLLERKWDVSVYNKRGYKKKGIDRRLQSTYQRTKYMVLVTGETLVQGKKMNPVMIEIYVEILFEKKEDNHCFDLISSYILVT